MTPPYNARYFETPETVHNQILLNRVAVVVDVLRATSTIITALYNGCRKVIPVTTIKEARLRAREFEADGVMLGGERRGVKISGFDAGNSPREYHSQAVVGRTIILTTTNGTKALAGTTAAKATLVLSFLNLTAVARALCKIDASVNLIAAGGRGKYSIEDSVCCGLLLDALIKMNADRYKVGQHEVELLRFSRPYLENIKELLIQSPHGTLLRKLGFENDLDFCSRMDAFPIVPVYQEGRIMAVNRV